MVVAGTTIVITPAHEQLHLESLCKAGCPRISTLGTPGAQGVVTGTQGMGVSTPKAADVAAETVGFDNELHMPNGMMFIIGAKSMMLAAAGPWPVTFGGMTANFEGAAPKLHFNVAPMLTYCDISHLSCFAG